MPTEITDAVKRWAVVPHVELAILCQAMFSLATHADNSQWIRQSAINVIDERLGAEATKLFLGVQIYKPE